MNSSISISSGFFKFQFSLLALPSCLFISKFFFAVIPKNSLPALNHSDPDFPDGLQLTQSYPVGLDVTGDREFFFGPLYSRVLILSLH